MSSAYPRRLMKPPSGQHKELLPCFPEFLPVDSDTVRGTRVILPSILGPEELDGVASTPSGHFPLEPTYGVLADVGPVAVSLIKDLSTIDRFLKTSSLSEVQVVSELIRSQASVDLTTMRNLVSRSTHLYGLSPDP